MKHFKYMITFCNVQLETALMGFYDFLRCSADFKMATLQRATSVKAKFDLLASISWSMLQISAFVLYFKPYI